LLLIGTAKAKTSDGEPSHFCLHTAQEIPSFSFYHSPNAHGSFSVQFNVSVDNRFTAGIEVHDALCSLATGSMTTRDREFGLMGLLGDAGEKRIDNESPDVFLRTAQASTPFPADMSQIAH